MARYTYSLIFDRQSTFFGRWEIIDTEIDGWNYGTKEQRQSAVVAQFPYEETPEDDSGRPPLALRHKFEELLGRGEFVDVPTDESHINLVELIADSDDCAFDQPCAYGYRVEQYAVYCHNESWLYAPSKCNRNRDWPHATCPGFKSNQPQETNNVQAN